MMKQDSLFLPCFPLNTNLTSDMTLFGEPDPDLNSGHILDWSEDSLPSLPLMLDDLYDSTDIIDINDAWWGPDLIDANTVFSSSSSSVGTVSSTTTSPLPAEVVVVGQPQEPVCDVPKKRKAREDCLQHGKRSNGNKRVSAKSTKENGDKGSNKNGRWAEQLLNPCAAAISSGNMTRVQHLVFVLQEVCSPTGDANYRLASHGLQAILRHLSAATKVVPTDSFATSTPKFFQRALINFNEINPWFTIPNRIANNAILQVLSEQNHAHGTPRTLHVVDIGVSHGFQWPTLLEALSRQPGGPPPVVRLTVLPPTETHQIPFANCPPGYDFASNILRFAKNVNINLQINRLENCPLQNLNSQVITSSPDETLIICAQFRLHSLSHTNPDNRTEFLNLVRNMKPQGVILTDNNTDCSCNTCSSFDSRFSQTVDYLWSFLDSTSVAFKGREMEERKLLEGEAATALINPCEMNEKKEKWGERMHRAGFVENVFHDDVLDQARSLLKKYDSHWEMRVDGKSIGLSWKGQSVSFCSLWKIDPKTGEFSS